MRQKLPKLASLGEQVLGEEPVGPACMMPVLSRPKVQVPRTVGTGVKATRRSTA